MRLVKKISLSFFAVASILVCIGGGIFYLFAKSNLEKSIVNHLVSVAASETDHIETLLKMLELSVGQFSKSMVLENLLKARPDDAAGYARAFDDASKRLKRTQAADPLVSEYLLLDKSGIVLASSDERSIGQDKSSESYFINGQKGVHIEDVKYCPEHKEFMLALSAPIFDGNGVFLGEVAAWTKLHALNSIVTDRVGLGKTGEVYIVNKDGFMLTPSRFKNSSALSLKVDTEGVREARLHTAREHPLSLEHINRIYPDYRGIPVLGAHEFIPQMHWIVLAEIDAAEAFMPLMILRFVFVFLVIFVSVFSWLLGSILTRLITGPLLGLTETVEKIGSGDMDYTISTDSDDEVGQLSRGFVRMLVNLKETTTSIENLNEEIAARRKTEEALLGEKVFSDSLIRSLPGFFFVLDQNGTFIRSNRYLEDFMGVAEGQLNGRPGVSVIFEDDRPAVAAKISEVFEKGTGFIEARCKSSKGDIRDFRFTGVRMHSEGSSLLVGTGIDITESRDVEKKLRASEELYSSVFSNIGIGVSVINPSMEIVSLNPIMKKWFPHIDVGTHPVCYRSFNSPPRDEPCVYCPTIHSLRDGNIHVSTTDTPTPEGVRNYRIISAAIKSLDGVITAAIEVVEDITDIVSAERSVREEKEKAERYLNTAEVMILALDTQARITLINRKGCQILGYAEDELLGRNWFEVFVPAQEAASVRRVYEKIMSGENAAEEYYENPVRIKSGGERLIAWHNTVLKDGKGMIVGTLSSGEDITERKKSENDLREAYKVLKSTQDQLLQASKMAAIGQLAGGVAHEINNPLTGILGNVQLIGQLMDKSDKIVPEEFKAILKDVEDSAVRCRKITRALLDFAHPSRESFVPLDVNGVVEKVMQIVSNELKLAEIAVVQVLQPGLPPINGDSQLLQQVLLGLIANAKWAVDKKTNCPDGTISIKTGYDSEEKCVEIIVEDDGIGIDEKNLKKMFEPFFTTKEVGEGTGLGLALIYNIIKNHGGAITVSSQVDVGTVFKIKLPAA